MKYMYGGIVKVIVFRFSTEPDNLVNIEIL